MKKAIYFGLISLLAIGCARHAKPDWAKKNVDAYLGNEVFYSVGTIAGVKNQPLGQLVAENKARAEIARIVEIYAAALALDYAASVSKEDFKKINERQNVALILRTYGATSVADAKIVDSWIDKTDGAFYSLAKLKLKSFKNNVAEADEVSRDLRKFVKKNAAHTFNRLKNSFAAGKTPSPDP